MPAVPHQHLARFAEARDEAAFAALVGEYGGLVFTSAHRRCGERELAEEIAQSVFSIAARKARRLAYHPSLTAWFYTTVRLETAKALRSRRRHNRRVDALAEEMRANAATADSYESMSAAEVESWRDALPLLDESLDRLPPADREILLGRFFEGRSFKEIADGSGRSEAACKMRAKRALGKLNTWLAGRGATLSAAALATGLTAEFAKGAPSNVAASLPSTAIAASAGVGTATILTNTLNTMSTIKSASLAAAAVLLIGAIPVAVQRSQADSLRERISGLEKRHHSLSLGASPTSPGDPLGNAAGDISGGDSPVNKFLDSLQGPIIADELITEMVAALMSQNMGKMMRVMLPLVDLSEQEGTQLLAEVRASEKAAQMKEVVVQMLSMMLSQKDGDPAESMDRNLSNGVAAQNIASTLRSWAKGDPDAAIEWFKRRRDEGLLAGTGVSDYPEMHLLAALVAGVAESDPDTAIALLDGYQGPIRNSAIDELATALALGDPARRKLAAELIAGLELPEERMQAAQSAATALSFEGRRDEALGLINAAGLDDRGLAMALAAASSIAGQAPESMFQERVAWAMENAPQSARDELVGELARSGVRSVPVEVSTWVDSLPQGPQQDAGLAAEAIALTQSDQIERALERAEQIGDPGAREESIRRAFVWLNHSNEGAAAKVAEEHGYDLDQILGR